MWRPPHVHHNPELTFMRKHPHVHSNPEPTFMGKPCHVHSHKAQCGHIEMRYSSNPINCLNAIQPINKTGPTDIIPVALIDKPMLPEEKRIGSFSIVWQSINIELQIIKWGQIHRTLKGEYSNLLSLKLMIGMYRKCMMTSSNGNICCITGPLWGEFPGHRWISLTKASDTEL